MFEKFLEENLIKARNLLILLELQIKILIILFVIILYKKWFFLLNICFYIFYLIKYKCKNNKYIKYNNQKFW